MGSPYRNPRPKSPERIRLRSIDSARFEESDVVVVQATFTYYTWCCSDSHEIVDAVTALEKAIQDAHDRAERKRTKKAQAEYDEIIKELSESREVQQ